MKNKFLIGISTVVIILLANILFITNAFNYTIATGI